jgi:2-polyprenyl-3-methyl-5-hydroxy-6-metoxy-1,4-benzoquinol methylase
VTVATSASAPSALRDTRCMICDTREFDRQVYAMNFQPQDLNADVFSARRLPDRLHYRMVRCTQCGLLRSDPILIDEELSRLYAGSHFTYAAEAAFTGETYLRYLRDTLPLVRERKRIMEIGCGSGFFLERALTEGFAEAWGVEPSVQAVEQASPRLRDRIRIGLYDRATFAAEQFDAICAFQILDHAPEPAAMLRACYEHLRPGGVALFINHDAGALSARLLGELSPIVDVEHTVLFDQRTMRRLFEHCGFRVHDVFSVRNTYPLQYWAKMTPLPGPVKAAAQTVLRTSGLGRIPIGLKAGNLGAIAVKG